MAQRIAVIPGDGIGPEITTATVRVLKGAAEHFGMPITFNHALIGWKAYEASRTTLPEETLAVLREHEGWILGPTFAGEYPKDDSVRGHPSGYLRRTFKLFANVRPVQAWPQLDPIIPDLDVIVIRENTEGFYPDRNMAWGYGEFKPTEDVALSLRVITGEASRRFAEFCFQYAKTMGHKKLAIVHKRTALPQTDGLFISAFEGLADKFPDVTTELLRVDTFSSSLPRDPRRFPLVATTNLFGDIISDQASGLAGGVGLAPSLNAGKDHAMAQAVHGTAPDIAGKGIANPSALILSTAMLLDWLQQRSGDGKCREISTALQRAVKDVINRGVLTADLGGKTSTDDFADAVLRSIVASAKRS